MNHKINIGIDESSRKELAQSLAKFLADTYALTIKTQNFHWNVTGPNFSSHHKFFAELYENLAEANDEIAERLRTLGEVAPGSLSEFQRLTEIKDAKSSLSSKQMIEELLHDHETIVRYLRGLYGILGKGRDEGTADFITGRIEYHEKTAWMLRSHLGD